MKLLWTPPPADLTCPETRSWCCSVTMWRKKCQTAHMKANRDINLRKSENVDDNDSCLGSGVAQWCCCSGSAVNAFILKWLTDFIGFFSGGC